MTQVLQRPAEPLQAVPHAPKQTRRARTFRPDIEGLRAFAVLAVVFYHAHLLGISGGYVGVDVFFVISGFLITRQLVESVGVRGIAALPTFYTRRIRRLLPASAVVLVATVLVARVAAPALQVHSIAVDAIYTTFYGLNYRLASTGTQYLHQGDSVSPLQHFWSLGVEEQFYVAWPLIIAAFALAGHRHARTVLTAVLAAVAVTSFYFCVTVTTSSQPWAYFSLHTRAWELALGGLVALGANRLAALPRRAGELAAALGLLAVIGSGFVYNDSTRYPGVAAALPVVGTALVIAAGCGARRRVERVLAEPMMQCIGKISYSWYLWHWPMLILAPMLLGTPLGTLGRLIVVLASMTLALISFQVVENPVRSWRLSNPRWLSTGFALSGTVLAACLLVIALPPALVGRGAVVTVVQATSAGSGVNAQLQAAVTAGLSVTAVPRNLMPQPAAASADTPASSHNGCHADFLVTHQGTCVYGDPNGHRTAVLFGDSHMEQWLPAFDAAGAHSGWRIVNWTKAACPVAQLSVVAPTLNRAYTECDSWRAATIARIVALRPQLIFIGQSETAITGSVSPSRLADATIATLHQLAAAGAARVSYLDDIPVPNYDMPGCVAAHLSNGRACNFTLAKAYRYPQRHAQLAPRIAAAGFPVVEPAPWLCTSAGCPAIIGNYLVYRNATHLSASFSRWLAPRAAALLTVRR